MILVAGHNPASMGKLPFKTVIPTSKDDSKDADERAPEHVKIYLDGSAQDGEVGVVVVFN